MRNEQMTIRPYCHYRMQREGSLTIEDMQDVLDHPSPRRESYCDFACLREAVRQHQEQQA